MATFREGDIVKFKDPEALRTLDPKRRVPDTQFTLDDINVDGFWEGEDADEYWADGWNDYGTVSVQHPDEIELVMSAADAAKRTPPSHQALMDHIGSNIMTFGEGFDINGVDKDGNNILVYGRTDEGINFSFVLGIGHIVEGDF